MAAAEKELQTGIFVEERIARIESDTAHIRKDLIRIEGRIDKLDGRLDKLDDKIDRLDEKLNEKIDEKFDAVSKSLVAFQLEVMKKFGEMEKSRWIDRVWWLVIAGGLLGVMARGLKWI